MCNNVHCNTRGISIATRPENSLPTVSFLFLFSTYIYLFRDFLEIVQIFFLIMQKFEHKKEKMTFWLRPINYKFNMFKTIFFYMWMTLNNDNLVPRSIIDPLGWQNHCIIQKVQWMPRCFLLKIRILLNQINS